MEWTAEWISLPGQNRLLASPAPYFRREFELRRVPERALVTITALGLYELWINGQRVGNVELAPGWTDYRKRVPFQQYEVRGYLQPGQNAIGVKLGDGWYCGKMFHEKRQFYGEFPELLFQMDLHHPDASPERIQSDGSWKAIEGPIRSSDLYDGEVYDARLEMPGWNCPQYSDGSWIQVASRSLDPGQALDRAEHQPVREIEERSPVEIWEIAPGRWIFDLGQNMVGRARILVPGQAGNRITIRFAEMLHKDRSLYTANYRLAKSTDTYICHGRDGFEKWEPVFTFHGFRYVELSGLDPAVHPDTRWVTGVVLHNDMARTGDFSSSNPLLNQLQNNIVWGQKGNFLEVPTDCPQRDERLGWTGDAQTFCPTACFNFDTLAFFHKWMADVRDAQQANGAVPNVVPDGFDAQFDESPAWGDAVAIVPWEVYVRFGDQKILKDNYPAILRWVQYLEADSPGLIRADRGFGDWLQPYQNPAHDNRGDTSRSLIGTAYFARSTDIAGKIARLLDRRAEATRLRNLARSIRVAFVANFWNDAEGLTSHTQTAYLLALAFDMLPERNRASAFNRLLQLLEDADGHLRTGFVGTPLLAPTLTRFGRLDLAYQILLKDSYPGWLYSIRQGATTMWERWNSYSRDEGFGDAEMNSFNHYAYGAIGQWMYEVIGGLVPDPDNPGYRHFLVSPQPGGGLNRARTELQTRFGLAASSWHLEEQTLIMEATVPEGSEATIVFPWGNPQTIFRKGVPLGEQSGTYKVNTSIKVEPGKHSFVILPDRVNER